jgi:hypothetical protein
MGAKEIVLAVGVLLSIAACDKKDSETAPAPASGPAAATAAAAGEAEHKDREHGREERMDGGREHEQRQPK